jgi:hypothetical protein
VCLPLQIASSAKKNAKKEKKKSKQNLELLFRYSFAFVEFGLVRVDEIGDRRKQRSESRKKVNFFDFEDAKSKLQRRKGKAFARDDWRWRWRLVEFRSDGVGEWRKRGLFVFRFCKSVNLPDRLKNRLGDLRPDCLLFFVYVLNSQSDLL